MTTIIAIIILCVIIGWLLYVTYNNYYKKNSMIEGLETATTTATTTKDVTRLSDKLDSITNTLLTDCGLNVDNPDQATNLSNLKKTLSSLDTFLEAVMVSNIMVGPNAKNLTNNATNSNMSSNLGNAFQLALSCVDIQNGRDSIDKVMTNLPDIPTSSASASASASAKSMFGF